MRRGRAIGLGIVVSFIILLGSGYIYYASTGGNALTRVIFNYLIPDLPDKKYNWSNFVNHGEGSGISGFYAYGDSDSFSLWTLSGLITFTHVPGISVYMHQDICKALSEYERQEGQEKKSVKAETVVTGEISAWQGMMRREYLVSVTRLKDSGAGNGVDKVWSYSGIYRQLNRLEEDTCK